MITNKCSDYIIVHMFEQSNAECLIWLLYFSYISQFIPSLIEVRVFLARLDKGIQLITSLGYTKQYPVIKHRQYFHKEQMTACLDQVEYLGDFLEVEMIVENEHEKEQALDEILEFLQKLGFSKEQLLRKSYLSMLQEKQC